MTVSIPSQLQVGSLADNVYGAFPRAAGQTQADAMNPAAVPPATRASAQPARKLDAEPGFNAKAFSPASLLDNPTTWLVVTLALGIAAARYAAVGRLL